MLFYNYTKFIFPTDLDQLYANLIGMTGFQLQYAYPFQPPQVGTGSSTEQLP